MLDSPSTPAKIFLERVIRREVWAGEEASKVREADAVIARVRRVCRRTPLVLKMEKDTTRTSERMWRSLIIVLPHVSLSHHAPARKYLPYFPRVVPA